MYRYHYKATAIYHALCELRTKVSEECKQHKKKLLDRALVNLSVAIQAVGHALDDFEAYDTDTEKEIHYDE